MQFVAGYPLFNLNGMLSNNFVVQYNTDLTGTNWITLQTFSNLLVSPYHGFSVEFTEYRQYSPGDDTRYLDWRLYARSDRYYLKKFEDETNLRCLLFVDQSLAMRYG